MEKVYLQMIIQHGNKCFIGKYDPRKLVEIATKVEMSATQDAQRPLSEKRVKDIASYVNDDNGILPSTLTIATKDDRIKIVKDPETESFYYTLLPNKESEYKDFINAIDVMDGQHRLYSFTKDIRLIPDTEKYEIGFTLYDKPTLIQRRKIFISCNEKQEKVSANLLLWFKEKLNMLSQEDKRYYDIVNQLANEYPLKGHVILSAEKVKNGVKAKEIIADLKHAKILELSTKKGPLSDENIVLVLKRYLSAWQSVVGFDFSTSSRQEAGVAIKMAGLKYMIYVLPSVWDYSISCKEPFSDEFAKKTIRKIIDSYAVEYSTFFTNPDHNKYFRDRTMISKFADDAIDRVKKLDAEDFDPLA